MIAGAAAAFGVVVGYVLGIVHYRSAVRDALGRRRS